MASLADMVVAERTKGFRNAKHRAQWERTLGDAYCSSLRTKRLDRIVTEDVLAVLRPMWSAKQETASRVRARIELVLDAARASGHRDGENPARWRGHLDRLLSERTKLQRGRMAGCDALPRSACVRPAAEASPCCRCPRPGIPHPYRRPLRRSSWRPMDEMDLDGKVWIIPQERMKASAEHRVPLTPRMIEILTEVMPLRQASGLSVPGSQGGPRPFRHGVQSPL